jgi:integrase/recombinase XerD
MKTAKFLPKKTSKGWQILVPASLSDTGKKQRRYFKSRDAATKYALEVKGHKNEYGTTAPILPPGLSELASRAFDLLSPLPPEEIIKAVQEHVARRDQRGQSITFAAACERYRESKAHRTSKHLDDYIRLPKRFPGIADRLLCDITPKDIEDGLAGLPGPFRNLNLRELRALFNLGIKRDWCKENPVLKVDTAHVAAPGVPVLTGEQLERLFMATQETDNSLVAMLAIEAFCGVRPTEATKIDWRDFDFVDGVLTVPDHAAKTRRARHITMHPTAIDWLNAAGIQKSGPVCRHLPGTLRKKLRAIRINAGIVPWPQDCLRHTFASAALASGWRDIGQLCLDLGHTSQAMLHKHYHRALRKAEGQAWFNVLPSEVSEKIYRISA